MMVWCWSGKVGIAGAREAIVVWYGCTVGWLKLGGGCAYNTFESIVVTEERVVSIRAE
jgi:hypothetical protein